MNAFELFLGGLYLGRNLTPEERVVARCAWDAALCAAADALMRNGTAMKTVELQCATMSGISRLHSWASEPESPNTEFPKP